MKKFLKASIFVLVLLLVYIYASFVFIPKSFGEPGGQKYYRGKGYISEPKDSIEIMSFGNSDLYFGLSPLYLYDLYGYTSYSCGVSRQNLRGVYTLLTDSVNYQNPKLVILEVDCFFSKNKRENSKFNNFMMRSTFIFRNHSRWKDLKPKDFVKLPNYKERDFQRGHVFKKTDSDFKVGNFMGNVDDKPRPFGKLNDKYIDKIMKFCEEKNYPVLFVAFPSAKSWSYAKHNRIRDFAKEKNIPFIDMNLNVEEIGIRWDDHFIDDGNHLNCYGSDLATKYLGEYLNKNYVFTDQRTNPEYSDWNEAVIKYKKLF